MAGSRTLSAEQVRGLRRLAATAAPQLDVLLRSVVDVPVRSAAALRELHDLLLFVSAYPTSASQHAFAEEALSRLSTQVEQRLRNDARLAHTLCDSGLHGSDTLGLYSFTLVRWMLDRWPDAVSLHSLDAPVDEVAELLRPLLIEPEREAVDMHDGDAAALMGLVFGPSPGTQLRELVALLQSHAASHELREALFARLRAYVRIEGGKGGPSLTAARGPDHPPFVHPAGIDRGVDVLAEIARPIGAPMALDKKQRLKLIDDARAVLCLMQRETDPVTYAEEAQAFDMGRGLVIALFHMDAAHRLALESYVGFMAFKNGRPLGYGGAWLFPGRSKVGINVFPSLRGGESAWFFAQLLRLYRQRFGVGVFEAENYQLGHGNADGLKSGAYWFYYRLGFRPWNDRLGRIAANEFKRMQNNKGHHPPLRTLKELVADGLVLRVADEGLPMIDTAALIHAAQRHAATADARDRQRLIAEAERQAREAFRLTPAECLEPGMAAALRAWLLPLNLLEGYPRWPAAELRRMGRALRAKAAGTEDRHQSELRECSMLLRSWAKAIEQA